MTQVLAGIRVLDFGRYIAGPYCATLLGDFGAEVIRIEKVDGSEDRFVMPVGEGGEGALFLQVNRNKRSLTLNPMKPAGREIVRRLVATADVVIANLPPPTLVQMGLDHATLAEINPRIVLTTASAFESGGPYSHRVGFDGIGQAMSGAMAMTGHADEPMRANATYVDYGTAMLLAYGTLAALMARDKTGRGQQVEASLLRTALTQAGALLTEQAVIGTDRVGTGNRGQTSGPTDVFATRDGRIMVQSVGQPLFERWARLMGEDHWLGDPRFADDIGRGNNGTVISARMARWCATRTTAEALSALEEARLPAGPVLTAQQALDDPHVRAMEYLKPLDYPGLPRPAPIADTPVRLSATPGTVERRAPTLGEHTDQILTDLGYTPDDIATFRAERVV